MKLKLFGFPKGLGDGDTNVKLYISESDMKKAAESVDIEYRGNYGSEYELTVKDGEIVNIKTKRDVYFDE